MESYPKLEALDEDTLKHLVEDSVDWAHVSTILYFFVPRGLHNILKNRGRLLKEKKSVAWEQNSSAG